LHESDGWNTDMTDELQESNMLQTINESDDGWNTDITDEFQESDLLIWDFDHLPNSSYLSNSSASSSTTNKLDNTDDIEIIQLGSCGNTETAGRVKYRLEFEEYPETAPDGVACIYNIAGMDPEKACEIFDLKNIQYSYKDGTTRDNVHCSFLNTKVYKETRSCRGVKYCQFISPELKNASHTVVDFDDELFKKIFEANELSVDTATL
ncbi:17255_t:CDS:2, partial [Gigaspora rosea]